ncbi:GTPase activating protein [Apophysomyces ossiformis]|uniref:GTPase-activating protein GYP7 n=1 Tax=Apophysomyces ossiformis TaxID=679940 RepID=A0A8H7ELP0_9FUNG|nr:GTPase activating protein [Apophysomyces ossiformis]
MDNSSADSFALINDPRVPAPDNAQPSISASEIPVKLLYSKSKVYVHPSSNTSDYIPGYLSIVEKDSRDILVSWTPEALIPSKDLETFVQVDINLEDIDGSAVEASATIPSGSASDSYALYGFAAPIKDIHSLSIQPPSLTKWYGSVVFNFIDGHSSTPFWFHDDESQSTMLQKKNQGGKFTMDEKQQTRWGGDEFIDRICQFTSVSKSQNNKHLYIIEQRDPLKDFGVNKVANRLVTGNDASNNPPETQKENFNAFESAQMDPFVAVLKETRWSILEKLSRVTRFSRTAAVSILGHPASRHIAPFLPPSLQELCSNQTVKETIDDYDSARIFLAKWAAGLAAQSEKLGPQERRYLSVGIWGHDDWEEDTALGVFEILNSEDNLSIPTHTRKDPITPKEWASFFDESGKLSVGEPYLLQAIFCGGLEPVLRKEAWLFLTGVYPWDSTASDRENLRKEKTHSYKLLKVQWAEDEEYKSTVKFQEQKHRIDKDVHRTDRCIPLYARDDIPSSDSSIQAGTNQNLEILKDILCTYNVYNAELGYVQGMSDLLSPLYAVISDEALVFWAFVGFMERMKSNFYMDQSGMHEQLVMMDALIQFMDPSLSKHFKRTDSFNLFFCFRWLLVWFKREFAWDDMMMLWEVLWTDHLSTRFHLFVALAILDQNRDVMIEYLKNFDEILKYINDLAMTMDLREILQRAEILYYQFRQRVEAVKNKKQRLNERISTSQNETERKEAEKDLHRLPVINDVLERIITNE